MTKRLQPQAKKCALCEKNNNPSFRFCYQCNANLETGEIDEASLFFYKDSSRLRLFWDIYTKLWLAIMIVGTMLVLLSAKHAPLTAWSLHPLTQFPFVTKLGGILLLIYKAWLAFETGRVAKNAKREPYMLWALGTLCIPVGELIIPGFLLDQCRKWK